MIVSAPSPTIGKPWPSLLPAGTLIANVSMIATGRRTSRCSESASAPSPTHSGQSAGDRRALRPRSGSPSSTSQPSPRRLRPTWSRSALQRAAERPSRALDRSARLLEAAGRRRARVPADARKQIARRHSQRPGELRHRVDPRHSFASLQQPDLGSMQARAHSRLFLGLRGRSAGGCQVPPELRRNPIEFLAHTLVVPQAASTRQAGSQSSRTNRTCAGAGLGGASPPPCAAVAAGIRSRYRKAPPGGGSTPTEGLDTGGTAPMAESKASGKGRRRRSHRGGGDWA